MSISKVDLTHNNINNYSKLVTPKSRFQSDNRIIFTTQSGDGDMDPINSSSSTFSLTLDLKKLKEFLGVTGVFKTSAKSGLHIKNALGCLVK
jgi:hypothetical protein